MPWERKGFFATGKTSLLVFKTRQQKPDENIWPFVHAMEKVNLLEKLALIDEHWRPKIVGELNGQEVKVVKFKGEFPWHHHENEDELFMGLKGTFRLEFRDRKVEVGEGEFIIVPRGVEHRPVAEEEVEVMLFEPANLKNTGNIDDEKFTAPAENI